MSLGLESSREILDFNLNDEMPFDEIKDRLNAVMPEGMKIISVSGQNLKITAITEAEYSFSLVTEDAKLLNDNIEALLAQPEIFIEKKTKKGVKTVDIKPSIKVISCYIRDNSVDMAIRLPAGTQTNFNPSLFFEALKNSGAVPFAAERIRRTGIFCENNEIFS